MYQLFNKAVCPVVKKGGGSSRVGMPEFTYKLLSGQSCNHSHLPFSKPQFSHLSNGIHKIVAIVKHNNCCTVTSTGFGTCLSRFRSWLRYLLISCVILEKSLNLSVPQFLLNKIGIIITHYDRIIYGISKAYLAFKGCVRCYSSAFCCRCFCLGFVMYPSTTRDTVNTHLLLSFRCLFVSHKSNVALYRKFKHVEKQKEK